MALGAKAVRKAEGVHRKRDDSLNIWTCQVKGPRKTAKLKGYLLEDPELIFESLAPENPYLMLGLAPTKPDTNSPLN